MKNSESMAFLMTASNESEANIIESILNMEQIPIHRQEAEAGNYLKNYHGFSMYGVDIYVPVETLERAREIVSADVEEDYQDRYSSLLEDEEPYCSIRMRIGQLIVRSAIALSLSVLVLYLLQSLWDFITAVIGL